MPMYLVGLEKVRLLLTKKHSERVELIKYRYLQPRYSKYLKHYKLDNYFSSVITFLSVYLHTKIEKPILKFVLYYIENFLVSFLHKNLKIFIKQKPSRNLFTNILQNSLLANIFSSKF